MDKARYRAIKELAREDKKEEIKKEFTNEEIKDAYSFVCSNYNLLSPNTIPLWVYVIKHARDDIITAEEAEEELAETGE